MSLQVHFQYPELIFIGLSQSLGDLRWMLQGGFPDVYSVELCKLFRFYMQHLGVRLTRMIWAGVLMMPAMHTRTLTFGKRMAFSGDPDHIVIAKSNGDVGRYDLKTQGYIPLFPIGGHGLKVHCVSAVPNSHNNTGIGTAIGPIVIRHERCQPNAGYIDIMRYSHGKEEPTDCMDFHPSGSHFITAGPFSAGFFVWNYADRTSRQISTGINRVTALAYSPCGNYIAVGQIKLLKQA